MYALMPRMHTYLADEISDYQLSKSEGGTFYSRTVVG